MSQKRIFKRSQSDVERVTFSGRPQDINFEHKYISVGKSLVLVHQICVLDTKKLVISYSFSLGEMS